MGHKLRLFNGVLLLVLCVGCFSRGSDTKASGFSVILPVKAAWNPNGVDYLFSSSSSSTNPNDPSYDLAVASDVRANKAWNRNTDCSSVKIGIVDSGIDKDHDDLTSNLANPSSPGQNFSGVSASYPVKDENSHGTHVAGIIAARGNNGIGVAGICWTASMVVAKVTDAKGSAALSDVVDGLNYLLDQNAKVINASLGSYVPATTESENAEFEDIFSGITSKAASKGALIVAAAGNNGRNTDVDRTYPASLSSNYVISVASNYEGFSDEELLNTSNYGGGTVHLSAPGYSIHSTLPEYDYTAYSFNGNPYTGTKNYGNKSGTSMAAPMVAGTLALMWSHIGLNDIDALSLKGLLLNNVESYSGTDGVPGNILITGGFLDVGLALEAAEDFIN